jgi:hypothetical protein
MANNFPNLRPTLNLDMVNGIYVDPRVTFTRAGGRTFFGREMVKAEENLLIRSQEFANAAWSSSATAIVRTADTGVAPDGTTTADSWKGDGTTAVHFSGQLITLVSAPVSRLSIYAKADGVNFIQLFTVGGTGYANFDITAGAGVVGTAAAPFSDLTIQDVGSGWYRCTCLITSSASNNIYISLSNSSTATRAAASFATSDGVFLWGAQLEQRSFATAYTPTTTQPITRYQRLLKTAAANEWPREFDPVTGECLGRSVWESRTNLLQRSEEFNDAYWTKSNSAVTANQIIAPDGTLTADKLVTSNAVGSGHIQRSVTVSAGAHTLSVIAKAGEWSWVRVGWGGGGTSFNLATGALGTVGAGDTASIVPLGNGWYRCIITRTLTATTDTYRVYSTNADNAFTTGDGYSGIYIWGAQLEAGAFATPYIPTVASQITRLADSAVMTGVNFSSWFNPEQGCLFVDAANVGQNSTSVSLNDSTTSNRINLVSRVAGSSTGDEYAVVVTGGVGQASLSGQAYTTDSKSSISYKFNEIRSTMNGNTPGLDSVAVLPIVNRLSIGATTTQGSIYIKRLAYYPQALTAANLQAVTR